MPRATPTGSTKRSSPLYEQPPIDLGVKEELDAFVERRVREGGAPSEF